MAIAQSKRHTDSTKRPDNEERRSTAAEEGGISSGEDQRLKESNALTGELTARCYHTSNHSTQKAEASQGSTVKPVSRENESWEKFCYRTDGDEGR